MPKYSLYAVIKGSELEDIAEEIVEFSEEYAASRSWVSTDVRAVNTRARADWGEILTHAGLCISLPDTRDGSSDWANDVDAIIQFAIDLQVRFEREVHLGMCDNRSDCREDILEVDSPRPDTTYLKRYLGL